VLDAPHPVTIPRGRSWHSGGTFDAPDGRVRRHHWPSAAGSSTEGVVMGMDDKIDNKAEELKGKVKEGAGHATDDEELQAEGRGDQASGHVKQAGEKVKDAAKDVFKK
jgi:uncharacterized protein YjbJ (UPF0337 family)